MVFETAWLISDSGRTTTTTTSSSPPSPSTVHVNVQTVGGARTERGAANQPAIQSGGEEEEVGGGW